MLDCTPLEPNYFPPRNQLQYRIQVKVDPTTPWDLNRQDPPERLLRNQVMRFKDDRDQDLLSIAFAADFPVPIMVMQVILPFQMESGPWQITEYPV